MGRKIRLVALILGIIMLLFPYASPALPNMLDPVHGVMGASATGGVPSGHFKVEGIPGEAQVAFDVYGVPHIYATSDEMGFYAMGWVQASLRLFQMDLMRRVPEGRLSALVGESGLESDKFMIQSGIADSVNKSWEKMKNDPNLRGVVKMLEAYSRGVNDYIKYAEDNNLLPIEYRILGQKPEPWEPRDTIAVAKLIAYFLAWNTEDLVVQKIVDRFGPEAVRIAQIFDFINWSDTVTQADCSMAVMWSNVTGLNHTATFSPTYVKDKIEKLPVDQIIEFVTSPMKALGYQPSPLEASNNWVVNGSYTVSGKPIVANDPHLELSAPPIWLLVEINTPSYKSIGALFPGTPLVIIGRNQHLAWAFTNVMGDFTDYYYYKWSNNGSYLYKGKWLKPETETRKIKVWDPVKHTYTEQEVEVSRTVHGYLISVENTTLAVRWTGQDASFEVAFFYYLNNATSVREALQAQRYFHVPIQNFIVADDQGNFAYSPFGAYPNRTNLPVYKIGNTTIVNKGFLPFNGSKGEGEWNGYIPPTRIPILYNPPVPFVATANSKVWRGSCGDFVGWHYHDKYRVERIRDLLGAYINMKGKVDMIDNARIQLDHYDLGVRDYLKLLLDLTRGYNDPILDEIRDWYKTRDSGYLWPDQWQPSVALAWIFTFHTNLWEKIYGNATEHIWFFRAYYALHLVKAVERGDPLAVKMMQGETLRELAIRSFNEAVEKLKAYFGTTDYTAWKYGDLHYYEPQHPAFESLNLPKHPAAGATWSVNVAPIKSFDTEKGMPVTAGPSIRMIVCLATDYFWIQLPGGESGSPYSNHYFDIYEKSWIPGLYIPYEIGLPIESYGGPSLTFEGVSG